VIQSIKHPPRKKSDEIEWTEQELRRGLAVLIRLLRGAITDTVQEGVLKADEHARLCRQRHSLLFIPGLVKVLHHPDPELRRQRLYGLYAALGAVAVIFGHRVDDPILERLSTSAATKGRLSKAQTTKVGIVIGEELDKFRKQRPDEFRKLRRNGKGHHAVATRIHGPIEKRLKNELRRRTLGVPMVVQYLKKDPHF
jgi:hypothetical protein